MTIPQVLPEQYRTFFTLPSIVRDARSPGMTDRDEVAMMAELMINMDGNPLVPDSKPQMEILGKIVATIEKKLKGRRNTL